MKRIVIQVGHWNIGQITQQSLRTWRSANNLKSSTGGNGERDFYWGKVMPLLAKKLIDAGVQVFVVDSIYREETYNQNYDLWISLHDDGGGNENRCMISAPNRSTNPPYLSKKAFDEAERFEKIWKETYPALTGTENRDERITAGMRDYYAFDYVWDDTPSVIIEHFNRDSEAGKSLRNNPELVAEADFQSIIKFLGIKPKQEEDKTAKELAVCKQEKQELEKKVADLTSTLDRFRNIFSQIKDLLIRVLNLIPQ